MGFHKRSLFVVRIWVASAAHDDALVGRAPGVRFMFAMICESFSSEYNVYSSAYDDASPNQLRGSDHDGSSAVKQLEA